jgi:hypothetical protein
MTTQEASQLLRLYRPEQGLENIPQMREALAMAASDPALHALIGSDAAFDAAMTARLRTSPVPDGLQSDLLNGLASLRPPALAESSRYIGWFHFLSLGAAAIITISLALFFTYWYEPGPLPAPVEFAEVDETLDPVISTADQLYAALQPKMRGQPANVMREFLISNGGALPQSMPPGFSWESSRACDIVDINGALVSVICFESPDKSGMLHLFTFRRSDFPHAQTARQPMVREREGASCCATWADDDGIHVLYSEKGQENLRRTLAISTNGNSFQL